MKQSATIRPARTLPWERRQRKTLRTIYLLVAITVLVMGFPKLYFHWQLARENRLIRAMGLPATFDEMNQDGPDTPTMPEADAYARAFEILVAKEAIPLDSQIIRRIEESSLDTPFGTKLLRDTQKNLSQYSPVLDLIDAAAQHPIRHFSAEIRQRHASDHSLGIGARKAAHQAAFAALLAAERFDADETCGWLLTLMTVIDTMRLEYVDGIQFGRAGSLELARDVLEHALALEEFTDKQLAALTKAWLEADDPKAVLRMLAVRRQEQLQDYRYPKLVMSGHQTHWSPLDKLGPNSTERALVAAEILGWNAGDKVRYLREMRGLMSALSKPWHTFAPQFEQRENEYLRHFEYPLVYYPIISQRIMSQALHNASYFFQTTTDLRLAAAALGIERYRLRYGEYPGSLGLLVPDFLPDVPMDPADGAPLRYCFTETGCAVYSISMNLEDDGGIPPASGRYWRWEGDAVFELRPARSRTDFSTYAETIEDVP